MTAKAKAYLFVRELTGLRSPPNRNMTSTALA